MSNTINIQRTKKPNICPDCEAEGINSCTLPHSDIITFSAKAAFSTEEAKNKYEIEHGMSQALGHVHWHNLQFNMNIIPELIRKDLKDYDGTELQLRSDDPLNGEKVELEAIDALIDANTCMDLIRNKLIKKNYLVTCISIASHILQSENILDEKCYKSIHDGTSLIRFCLEESFRKLSLNIEFDSADSSMFTISPINQVSDDLEIFEKYLIILPKKQTFFEFFVGKNIFNIATKDKESLHTDVELKRLMLKQMITTLKLTLNNFGRYSSVNSNFYIKEIKHFLRHL